MTIELAVAAEKVCVRLLGIKSARAETSPSAPYKRRQHSSVRVDIGDKTVVATHRRRSRLARLEATVLTSLHDAAAPVPRLLASDGNWLIQEDAGRRLPLALSMADDGQTVALIDAAMAAVLRCQAAGQAASLSEDENIRDCGWGKLLRAVPRVGRSMKLASPETSGCREILLQRARLGRFIKWDTRLGNALLDRTGNVIWIDWEECGVGDPARDLVKILCDDWVADRPEMETRLIEKYLLPLFTDDKPFSPETIIALYGTLLSVTRIEQILNLKKDGPWWQPEVCLDHDLIAVTPQAARRHCLRGARWARRSPLMKNFAPWLEKMSLSELFQD